jgi:FMN phosphatase YigB (HAD superfamily)
MTITLLLDLDDTLLKNDIRRFMPVYLKGLGSQLARHVLPEKTIRELLAATEAMIRNDRPDLTLEEKFDERFYPALGLPKADLQPDIDNFYANIYPTIRSVTSPYPQAARLIDYAIRKGHRLAIATNPLFPLTAITQRLTWAGFPPQDFPFVIVPSYETFHFAKPDPAFFSELLGQIGWPNEPVIMVGNDQLSGSQMIHRIRVRVALHRMPLEHWTIWFLGSTRSRLFRVRMRSAHPMRY